MEARQERYGELLAKFEEYMKPRIDFVIENTLHFVEMTDFFQHMVRNNENIQLSELSGFIHTIFEQYSDEEMLLDKAHTSAIFQKCTDMKASWARMQQGFALQGKKCDICEKLMNDEEYRERRRRQIKRSARRGTFIMD